jgi:branched-subunit amino acid transport protein AzlD
MCGNFVYLLVLIAAVGALSFALRALPFVLYAGSKGKMPAIVRYIGAVLSPAAIAMLCIYCFSGNLQFCGALSPVHAAAWLGGAATVILHLWRGNPLISILSGTALYMTLIRVLR